MKRNYLLLAFTTLYTFFLSCGNDSKPKTQTEVITQSNDTTQTENKNLVLPTPLNIESSFFPCGWMGDGQMGKQYISFEGKSKENPHSTPTCIKVSYKTGPKGWAGIYWLSEDCNWGDTLGYNLSKRGFTRITFWARGARGQESVQFKAGGVTGRRFNDSFDCESKLYVSLESQWRQYTIDLNGKDLSNVIGGFCWVSNSNITFYLDDMQYE